MINERCKRRGCSLPKKQQDRKRAPFKGTEQVHTLGPQRRDRTGVWGRDSKRMAAHLWSLWERLHEACFPLLVKETCSLEVWAWLDFLSRLPLSPGVPRVAVNMAGGAHSHGALSTATASTPDTEERRAIAVRRDFSLFLFQLIL